MGRLCLTRSMRFSHFISYTCRFSEHASILYWKNIFLFLLPPLPLFKEASSFPLPSVTPASGQLPSPAFWLLPRTVSSSWIPVWRPGGRGRPPLRGAVGDLGPSQFCLPLIVRPRGTHVSSLSVVSLGDEAGGKVSSGVYVILMAWAMTFSSPPLASPSLVSWGALSCLIWAACSALTPRHPPFTRRCRWHWWATEGLYSTSHGLYFGVAISHFTSQTCLCYLNGLLGTGRQTLEPSRRAVFGLGVALSMLPPRRLGAPELRLQTWITCVWEDCSPRPNMPSTTP